MDAEAFRSLALSLPESQEKSHFGQADFRVGNRIFASLPKAEVAVLKLSPGEQEMLLSSEPRVFSPVKGTWGTKGWTELRLAAVDEVTLESVLWMAWRNAAPAALQKRHQKLP